MAKLRVFSEFWEFMKHNKKFWLAPIVIVLALVGALLILAKGSAVAPFIYTLV
jgi:competence protein ComGC